jgi:hypothetical protein
MMTPLSLCKQWKTHAGVKNEDLAERTTYDQLGYWAKDCYMFNEESMIVQNF